MIVRSNIHLDQDDTIRAVRYENTIAIGIDSTDFPPGAEDVTIFLPDSDEDALLVCSMLEAALDNAVSYVRLRQQKREGTDIGTSPDGAGSMVEAYRG